ncbi:DUF2147 domain-containing protein [Sorangium sp. So ce124]|uniref:Exported protein n=1 Tax=Sorangium cellulosum TaxID=56 RepID=A0A3S7UWH0_SORCE|nr:exported protein [Sorangium cellulosum]
MKRFLALLAALGCSLTTSLVLADPLPVTGQWRTIDEQGVEQSVVEIYEKGGKIFGKIVSLKQPLDEKGKPKICTACEGADKNKPIVGLVIIRNMVRDDDEYDDGTILDPNNGETYSCKLEAIEGGKKLKVRGFLGISLLGRTQTWLKK